MRVRPLHLRNQSGVQYARLAKTIKLSAVAVAARRPPKQAAAAPLGAKKVTENEIAAEFAGLGVGSAEEEAQCAPPPEPGQTAHAKSSPARDALAPATAAPDSAAAVGSSSLDDLL